MMSIHHRPIKMFVLNGTMYSDSIIARLKNEYLDLLKSQMKLSGYVQRLDIAPDFTISYNSEKQYFEFELSIYGTFVGKKKVEWIAGIDGTVVVPILKSRLKEYSSEVA